MYNRASNYTPVAAAQTDSLIASGLTITVYGIIVSNSSGAGTVTLEEADGTTLIQAIPILAGDSISIDICFLADLGLAITTTANTTCTVFHGNPGA